MAIDNFPDLVDRILKGEFEAVVAFGEYAKEEAFERVELNMVLEAIQKIQNKENHPQRSHALNLLGYILERGLVGEPNYPIAIEYYQQAIALDNVYAMYNLAYMYSNAIGTPRDTETANKLQERADYLRLNADKFKPDVLKKSTSKLASMQLPPVDVVKDSISGALDSIKNLLHFYGTDIDGNRDGYGSTISRAIKTNIAKPITEVWDHRRVYFFKPYQSVGTGLIEAMNGPLKTALSVSSALAIINYQYIIASWVCQPVLLELITGLTSLGLALYHKNNALSANDQKEHDIASEYFLDATTRFALVIPLTMLCIVSLPIDTARFLTRTLASLIQLISDCDLSLPSVDAELQEQSIGMRA